MSEKQNIEVRHTRYEDLPRLLQTGGDASKHDPLSEYLADAHDREHSMLATVLQALGTYLRRAIVYLQFGYYVHYHSAFTIEHGMAFVNIERPNPGRARSLAKRLISSAYSTIINRKNTPEQRKRWKEYMDKVDAATKAAFGDNINNMLQVVNLATAPECQGKGYGTALMATANAEADRLDCSSWLLSSNTVNTPFYEHCSFAVAKEIIMGDDNPAWTKPPFKMLIMMRARRDASKEGLDEKCSPL